MLSWIRKRAGSFWAKALYVGIAITFFGGFGLLSGRVESCNQEQIDPEADLGLAMVDGSSISDREYDLRLRQRVNEMTNRLRQQFQDQPIPEGLIPSAAQLAAPTMKALIQEHLIQKEAGEMGISVSDKELQTQIATIFGNGNPATFDPASYTNYIQGMQISEQEFEDEIRRDLIKAKVLEAIKGTVSVLPDEIRERYAFDHQPVKVEYVAFDPAVLAPDALPGATAIKTYYEDHLNRFLLDETRQVEFASWNIPELAPGVTVTEQEIQDYYDKAKDRYILEPEQVRAQHILIKVDPDGKPEDIDKAKAMIAKIQEELKAPGVDFGAIAKKYSEDSSKDQGGDLGFFARGAEATQFGLPAMVEPFEKAAFALEIGKVSEPVQTQFGFHLIKVTEKKPPKYNSLDQVRKEIETQVREAKAMETATSRAETMRKAINEGKSFADAATAAGAKVKSSPFFQARDQEIPGVPDSRAIIEGVFALNEGEVTEALKGEQNIFVAKLVKISAQHQATLAEVKDRIIDKLKPEVQRQAALAAATALIEKVKKGEMDFAALAAAGKTDVKKADAMRMNVNLEGVVSSDTVDAAVGALTAESPWAGPVASEDRIAIFHLLEAGEPDMSKFDAEKEEYGSQLLTRKQMKVIEAWLDRLVQAANVVYSKRWQERIDREE